MKMIIDGKLQDVLPLHIKSKWYQMILSGEKKEEYRSISRYYKVRFRNQEMLNYNDKATGKPRFVLFQNGYSQNCPQLVAKCVLSIGDGNPAWGAIPGEEYYKLAITELLNDERVERLPIKRE